MEEQDEEVAPTQPLEQRIGGVERRGLVDIVRKEDDTPAAAIAIGGLAEAIPRTFMARHCRGRRALQGHLQGGVLLPPLQCLSRPGPLWA